MDTSLRCLHLYIMRTKQQKLSFLCLALLALVMSACGSAGAAELPTPEATPTSQPTNTPSPEFKKQQEIMAQWRRGPHSRTFDRSMSEYPDCARCHSPLDWDPVPGVEPALECLAYLPAPDVTQGAAGGDAYHYVGCETCHEPGPDGLITGELAWLNPETKTYEPAGNSTGLCVKCHMDTPVAENGIDLGRGRHAQLECADCHNVHRLDATCTNGGCHASVAQDLALLEDVAVLPGHEVTDMHTCGSGYCHPVATKIAEENQLEHIGLQHAVLNCTACHDATGLPAAPQSDGFHWTTWQTMVGEDGEEYRRPYFSHNVTSKVDCTRCHYEDNPWKLPFPVKSGQPTAK